VTGLRAATSVDGVQPARPASSRRSAASTAPPGTI